MPTSRDPGSKDRLTTHALVCNCGQEGALMDVVIFANVQEQRLPGHKVERTHCTSEQTRIVRILIFII